jgi:secreted PhoX family phosphatase
MTPPSAPAAAADADATDPARRAVLKAGALAALFGSGCAVTQGPGGGSRTLGFKGVPVSTADTVVVPEGYVAQVLTAWGDPCGIAGAPMPAFRFDAGNSAEEQALQQGMHHDGMHFYPLAGSSRRGLLVTNHEYVDDGLLHDTGTTPWTAQKVAKSQAAHGISVVEVERRADGSWQVRRPSPFARRITAHTPMQIGGPAAGHALMKTAADTTGTRVLGTFANCGAGQTPWGTFLSGEEYWQNYFATADTPTAHERRYGLRRRSPYRWAEHDERFDAVRHPNEPNRFGWVVELDPMDPASTPVKRTALGRAAREGAWVAVTRSSKAVVYSGEDEVFEYLYRFVSRDAIRPAGGGLTAAQANATLLDHGTLYVARFDEGGRGRWLPLVHGQGPLTAANGFADQGEVLIKARQACDAVGATRMDRVEWIAVEAGTRWVYGSLTNARERGEPGRPPVDAVNPRPRNTMGQIVRWREEGDHDGDAFEWNHLLLAGDPQSPLPEAQGNIRGDAFACPDTVAFDPRGVLWIGSDIGNSANSRRGMERMGNNQLLACDPTTGEVRRFLTGPLQCELTAATFTPDGRTLFVNIQHPGEAPSDRNDPAQPRRHSNWPDFRPDGRPRSATLAIRRLDGGVVGA